MSPPVKGNLADFPASRSSSIGYLAVENPLQRRITPPNEILFLDNNQDARTMKSTIQRHTAYHAAAQRREARLQTSRERTPRNLEWQRRASVETSASTPSQASTLSTPAPTTPDITAPMRQDRSSMNFEEVGAGWDRRRSSAVADHTTHISPVEVSDMPFSSAVLRNIGDDEIGRRVLKAYQLAVRAQSFPSQDSQHWEAREGSLKQVNLALGVLRQRLVSGDGGYSDATIQAVLVLFVYACRFQSSDEAASHRTALRRMIGLRGGLDSFGHNPILAEELCRFTSGSEVQRILRVMP